MSRSITGGAVVEACNTLGSPSAAVSHSACRTFGAASATAAAITPASAVGSHLAITSVASQCNPAVRAAASCRRRHVLHNGPLEWSRITTGRT